MLENIVATFMLLALIAYALTGGADFGGGMWDLLAFGPRATRQRAEQACSLDRNVARLETLFDTCVGAAA